MPAAGFASPADAAGTGLPGQRGAQLNPRKRPWNPQQSPTVSGISSARPVSLTDSSARPGSPSNPNPQRSDPSLST